METDVGSESKPKNRRIPGGFTTFVLVGSGVGAALVLLAKMKATTCRGYPTDRLAVVSVKQAVENYSLEYGHLPDFPRRQLLDQTGQPLLEALLGAKAQNPRGIVFLSLPEAKNGKGGIVFDKSYVAQGLFDIWGRPLRVVLNVDDEDPFRFFHGGKETSLPATTCAVWSVGKDGVDGTKDDVKKW